MTTYINFVERQTEIDEQAELEKARTRVRDLLSIKCEWLKKEEIADNIRGFKKSHKDYLKEAEEYNERVLASYQGKPLVNRGSRRVYFSLEALAKLKNRLG
jgi:hypothetical protein